jgi:hypothetical protein
MKSFLNDYDNAFISERKNWKREQQKEKGRFRCLLHPDLESLTTEQQTHESSSHLKNLAIASREICHDFSVSLSV